MEFMYLGKPVRYAQGVEVPVAWKDSSRDAEFWVFALRYQVQQYFDRLARRGDGLQKNVIVHARIVLDNVFVAREVVSVEKNSQIAWFVHARHTAQRPKVSPFIQGERFLKIRETSISIEYYLETDGQLVVTRMYPGFEYQPPLPWQGSARDAIGGRDACVEFWNTHAYVLRDGYFATPAESQLTPPTWWKPMG
jgi:hypothetical protein